MLSEITPTKNRSEMGIRPFLGVLSTPPLTSGFSNTNLLHLAIWDERSTLHRAAADHFPQRRIIRRLEIDGDRPYFDPNGS